MSNSIYQYTKMQLFKSFLPVVVMLLFLSFISCTKETDKNGGEPGEQVNLLVNIESITEENLTTPKVRSMNMKPAVFGYEAEVVSHETFSFNDTEIDVIAAQGEESAFGKTSGFSGFKKVTKMASVGGRDVKSIDKYAYDVKMRDGVKYMFILKNKTTGLVEQAVQGVSGTALAVPVVRGQDYSWYTYSYDSEEDIDPLDRNTLQVETKFDKPFAYAKGASVKVTGTQANLNVIFKHKLQQLKVHLDTRGMYGDITDKSVSFAQNDYVTTTAIDVLTGEFIGTPTEKSVGNFAFTDVEGDSRRQLSASYYTAKLELNSYAVKVNSLKVQYVDGFEDDLTSSLPNNGIHTFNFAEGKASQVLHGHLKLYKKIPLKKILHIEGNTQYSHAASQANKASGAFLRAATNFGPTSNSVRVAGFEHEVFTNATAGALEARLLNRANYPDIIIAEMFEDYGHDDYDALYTYLEKGGAVFLMIDNNKISEAQAFFRRLFDDQNLKFERDGTGGHVFKIASMDSDVSAWPFSDTRKAYWGADNTGSTSLVDFPANKMNRIFTYTQGAANYQSTNAYRNPITMFRHKTFNLFFVGDRGFLANELPYGQTAANNQYKNEPYATDENHFPVPRTRYGLSAGAASPENGKVAGAWNVYNSAIFGNVMAHFIGQIHFKPVDRTP